MKEGDLEKVQLFDAEAATAEQSVIRGREAADEVRKEIAQLEFVAHTLREKMADRKVEFDKAQSALSLTGADIDAEDRRNYETTVAEYHDFDIEFEKANALIQLKLTNLEEFGETMDEAGNDHKKPTIH